MSSGQPKPERWAITNSAGRPEERDGWALGGGGTQRRGLPDDVGSSGATCGGGGQADFGSPVAVPDPRVEPRVYPQNGHAVTFWTYYEPVASAVVSPVDYASALHRLRAGMRMLATKSGVLFIDLETCCRGSVEFDLAHAPEEVGEHYPSVDKGLLRECRILVLAMITAWRWD